MWNSGASTDAKKNLTHSGELYQINTDKYTHVIKSTVYECIFWYLCGRVILVHGYEQDKHSVEVCNSLL